MLGWSESELDDLELAEGATDQGIRPQAPPPPPPPSAAVAGTAARPGTATAATAAAAASIPAAAIPTAAVDPRWQPRYRGAGLYGAVTAARVQRALSGGPIPASQRSLPGAILGASVAGDVDAGTTSMNAPAGAGASFADQAAAAAGQPQAQAHGWGAVRQRLGLQPSRSASQRSVVATGDGASASASAAAVPPVAAQEAVLGGHTGAAAPAPEPSESSSAAQAAAPASASANAPSHVRRGSAWAALRGRVQGLGGLTPANRDQRAEDSAQRERAHAEAREVTGVTAAHAGAGDALLETHMAGSAAGGAAPSPARRSRAAAPAAVVRQAMPLPGRHSRSSSTSSVSSTSVDRYWASIAAMSAGKQTAASTAGAPVASSTRGQTHFPAFRGFLQPGSSATARSAGTATGSRAAAGASGAPRTAGAGRLSAPGSYASDADVDKALRAALALARVQRQARAAQAARMGGGVDNAGPMPPPASAMPISAGPAVRASAGGGQSAAAASGGAPAAGAAASNASRWSAALGLLRMRQQPSAAGTGGSSTQPGPAAAGVRASTAGSEEEPLLSTAAMGPASVEPAPAPNVAADPDVARVAPTAKASEATTGTEAAGRGAAASGIPKPVPGKATAAAPQAFPFSETEAPSIATQPNLVGELGRERAALSSDVVDAGGLIPGTHAGTLSGGALSPTADLASQMVKEDAAAGDAADKVLDAASVPVPGRTHAPSRSMAEQAAVAADVGHAAESGLEFSRAAEAAVDWRPDIHGIMEALYRRIARAIENKETFRVVVMLPGEYQRA